MATAALIPHIHHERQEPGSMLCAQHALNALLQGTYFDPSQLADIAKRLDGLEQSQLDEDTWRSRDTASLNMDDTGYFSVSVLEQALEVWGLSLVRWRSEAMRQYQSKPEEQLAFVLNLESHWFTIRGFLGGYWFNLNSFLPQPSWVGPSYLGALLDAAETEGYSVFVVRAADDSRADFQSSVADECAATLPHASIAGNSGRTSTSLGATISSQGLRPSLSSPSHNADVSRHVGQDDEDVELQAALRASMADADLGGESSVGSIPGLETHSTLSRIQSPAVVGQRRQRGVHSGEEDSMEEEEETDAHVDAIAPSRRRVRGMGQGEGANLVTSRGMGVPFVLPTASGGRRRASRLQTEEEERLSSRRAARRASRRPSGSHQHPIAIDDDDDDDEGEGRFGALDVDGSEILVGRTRRTMIDDIDDDDDDFEELRMASSAPRSPFLNPAIVNAATAGSSDEDFHSLSSGEGANLDESWIAADTAILQRQAMMNDRSYDDEDAQLQAALAASIRDAESNSTANVPITPDWISEEDSKAIREAQLASWTSSNLIRQDSDQGPTPADVAKIAKMRAEAKKKEEDERLGIVATPMEEETANVNGGSKNRLNQRSESDSDSDVEEEEAPQMTAEEMRRARLARFGAAP